MKKSKKIRTEFNFVKQQLESQILENNMPLFDLLEDKEDSIGSDNMKSLRKSLTKNVKEGEKSVNFEVKRVSKLADKLEKLQKWQSKRRRKFLDWLIDYLNQIEAREEQDFKYKFCTEVDEFCLAKSFKHFYDEEKVFGLENEPEIDDVDDEIEEVEVDEDGEEEGLEDPEELGKSSLLATSETEVSEEKKEETKTKLQDKLGAFFGVDKNCGEKKDERSES